MDIQFSLEPVPPVINELNKILTVHLLHVFGSHCITFKILFNNNFLREHLHKTIVGQTVQFACRRLKLSYYPHPEHNSRGTTDINIRSDTLTLLKDKVGNMIQLINTGMDFWTGSFSIEITMDKWDHLTLKASIQQRISSLK